MQNVETRARGKGGWDVKRSSSLGCGSSCSGGALGGGGGDVGHHQWGRGRACTSTVKGTSFLCQAYVPKAPGHERRRGTYTSEAH